MAKGRKSDRNKGRPGVIIYFDLEPAIKKLDDTQRGKLLTAVLEYGHYGLIPDFDDPLLEMAWAFVQAAIDRDAESYADKVFENKVAGLTSAFKRNYAPKHGIDPDDEEALQKYIREQLSTNVDDRQPTTTTTTKPTPETTPAASITPSQAQHQPIFEGAAPAPAVDPQRQKQEKMEQLWQHMKGRR